MVLKDEDENRYNLPQLFENCDLFLSKCYPTATDKKTINTSLFNTNNMKTTLLTGILFFLFLTGLQAQDKYDYAVVSHKVSNKFIEVDINGENYEKIEVTEQKAFSYYDSEGLKQVKKMNNDGWEIFDTHVTLMGNGIVFLYYLKRKVN